MEGFQTGRLAELEALVMEKLRFLGVPWPPATPAVRRHATREGPPAQAPQTNESDPRAMMEIRWGTYLGGSGNDGISDVAVDAAGDVIVLGDTNSYDFPWMEGRTASAVRQTYAFDVFLAKLSSDGRRLLWATFLGTVEDPWSQVGGMALDGEGNIAVVATPGYPPFPTTPDSFNPASNGAYDLWVGKLAGTDGDLLWGTFIGGSREDYGLAIAMDPAGNVWMAGATDSNDIPVPNGIYTQKPEPDGSDMYIAKLSADGRNLLWGTYLGGTGSDTGWAIALDPQGDVIVGGMTHSADIPVPGGYDTTIEGFHWDMYVAKISMATNTLAWGTYVGGSELDSFPSLAVDGTGAVYVLGNTESPDLPTPGGYDRTFNGVVDMYLAKISPDCDLLWATYLGAGHVTSGDDIAVNEAGQVFVAGRTAAMDIPVQNGWMLHAGFDIYVAKFSSAGHLLMASCVGGNASDSAQAIAIVDTFEIVLAGATSSLDFPTSNGFDNTYGTYVDGAIVKVTDPSALGRDLYTAAAAHTQGAYGTSWRTDGMVLNPTESEVCHRLYYYPAGVETLCEARCLSGGAARRYTDIVGTVCGVEGDTAGGLRLHADGDILMTTRTYTEREDGGTYGQFMEAVEAGRGFWPGDTGHLIGLKQNADYRTNIGFYEIAGRETQVVLRIYNSFNALLLTSSFILPPSGWLQVGLAELGIAGLDVGRAEVEAMSGGAVLSYASVVDNRTGDAIAIASQRILTGSVNHHMLAAVAHTPGAHSTFWLTDLWLLFVGNPIIKLRYQTPSNSYEADFTLGQSAPGEIQNVVGSLFPNAGDGAGSLHLDEAYRIIALSRTYNNSVDGTYGQFIPAKGGKQLMSLAEPRWLLQLQCNTNYRTNIGFSEYEGKETRVSLRLFDLNGVLLGQSQYTVPANQNLQINDIFGALGASCAHAGAYARVEVLSGGALYPYASVVDNRTGDAIFVPGLEN
jgi:hypothetical protein